MPVDWTTKTVDPVKWKPTVEKKTFIDQNCLSDGFQIENGQFEDLYTPVSDDPEETIEDLDKDVTFYKDQMADKEHINLITLMEDNSVPDFPVVLSMENPGNEDKKAYLRTKKGNYRFIIPASSATSIREMVKYAKANYSEIAETKLVECNNPLLVNKLIEYEAQGVTKRYKFGVLYMKEDQKTDDEMYSNQETSEDYEEFLDFLGEKIELKGWTGFRGGLDIKHDSTGTHSIYSKMDDFELMYHVSTLLPYQVDDLQRVERKRHLGNDVVVLVYKEGNGVFTPANLKSHFNHVFVVIQKESNGMYRVEIATKPGVRTFSPFLPRPPSFPLNSSFKQFLQAKLINAERACMNAPEFKGKMVRTARELLGEMVVEFNKLNSKSKTRKSTSMNFESALKDVGGGRRGSGVGLGGLQKKNSKKGIKEEDEDRNDSPPVTSRSKLSENSLDEFYRELSASAVYGDISPIERNNYLKQFLMLDLDQENNLSFNSATTFFTSAGLSQEEVLQILKLSDVGQDGKILNDEFCVAYHLSVWKLKGVSVPDELPESLVLHANHSKNFKPIELDLEMKISFLDIFKKLDKDKDGILSAQDTQPFFHKYGINGPDTARIWALSDHNKDRRMNFEEFGVAQFLTRQKLDGKPLPSFITEELVFLRRRLREDLPEVTAHLNTRHTSGTSFSPPGSTRGPPPNMSSSPSNVRSGTSVANSPFVKSSAVTSETEPDSPSKSKPGKHRAKSVSGPSSFPMLSELEESLPTSATINGKFKMNSRPGIGEINEEFSYSPKNGRMAKAKQEEIGTTKNGPRQIMYVFVLAEGKEEEAKSFILANMIPSDPKPGEEYHCFQDRANKKTIVLEAMFYNRTTRKKWREGLMTNKVLERLQLLLAEPVSTMHLKKLEKLNK